MVLFTIIAGVIGTLIGVVTNESARRGRLEAMMKSERDRVLGILQNMGDGVLITGPDYRIRFMNPTMVRDFGEGIGLNCFEYLQSSDRPCEGCKLTNVIGGAIAKWEYNLPNGRTYELLASPYIDSDGVACQLAIFRNLTLRQT